MWRNLQYKNIEILPKPLLFNPVKHHLGFIREWIMEEAAKSNLSSRNFEYLIRVGNSQTDLYWGRLTIEEISCEITQRLKDRGVFQEKAYLAWLRESIWNFNRIELSDGSTWVFRPGEVDERYLHFHPGKYSLHSNRVRATNLKTAIALKTACLHFGYPGLDLDLVNWVREKWLFLPRIKSIGSGIERVFHLIDK